ncbi:hypothetical protein M2459_003141 [Parabacteroides sp. PF5-5]|nr:hypothetical protein [Parabacteroides sp. PH5-39]MDH6317431.1 hypothetical protein [Parabacteroides sp. PF5-13]MDH6321128.1 hypothetical protein [Parabacteroides sp. PH5-13]MDH6324860.1 hypothetical protein [Parabacteroides sp. PH5-8]MDH6328616.1 hypothetical protein [Parabacteroides sp. PH5-41]MDH6336371.1 hypothetical protein [Parabacteroides sp. PF5-5]MDH6347435.1 hypothetical protein [Parabacteroides sp. PH5-46]MDH6362444.1 hypothetical protein [Parabacteroides sp. PH5-16]MDH6378065.
MFGTKILICSQIVPIHPKLISISLNSIKQPGRYNAFNISHIKPQTCELQEVYNVPNLTISPPALGTKNP